jgi:hypothetical protein
MRFAGQILPRQLIGAGQQLDEHVPEHSDWKRSVLAFTPQDGPGTMAM